MDARIGWLLLGAVVGFILGYITRSLREIKQKVEEVDKHVTAKPPSDAGFVRNPIILDGILILVLALVVWSSFKSQIVSNDVEKTQSQLKTALSQLKTTQSQLAQAQAAQKKTTECTQEFLSKTIEALNERTTYTQAQASANVDLQKAFDKLITASLRKPPPDAKEARQIVETYAAALKHFIEISAKSASKAAGHPFPTNDEFNSCIDQK
jgi:Sec-independent protein translocase protein TatA